MEQELYRNNKNNYDDEIEIDLLELLFVIRRHIAVIMLVAVLAAVVAGAFTYYVIPKKYQATAQLYIVSASNESVVNLSDLQIATNLTSDYKELILSRPLMESVIRNLKLSDISSAQLANMIQVTNPSGTRILHITAETTDPRLSSEIANEVANLSVEWLPAIMESNKPNLIQDAVVPTVHSSPNLIMNTAIGALIGALAAGGYYVLNYLLDDSVKSSDDMEKYFGVVPFATIPEDKSANDGISDKPHKRKGEKR